VYSDMGGALAITPEGEVLEYDFETRITAVAEGNWRTAGFTRAARRFPELKDLAPLRPSSAVNCPVCGGCGVIVANIGCGTCWGTGWIVR
jgi:hypothetical protein